MWCVMKKWIKITLISLGSLVGILLVVVAVACWLIFTTARLTSIVNSLSSKYILCDTHFEKVDLTLFKTFPNAGIEIQNVSFVNPMDGSPSDTLAQVGSLTVGVNIREYLKHKNIIVQQVCLDDAYATIYINEKGENNFSIFPSSEDTTKSEPFQLPDGIDLDKIKLHNFNCRFIDSKDSISANVQNLNLGLAASLKEAKDGSLTLTLDVDEVDYQQDSKADIDAVIKNLGIKASGKGNADNIDGKIKLVLPKAQVRFNGSDYINDALLASGDNLLDVTLPFEASLNEKSLSLKEAELSVDRIKLMLEGLVCLAYDTNPMQVNLDFSSNDIPVDKVLPYIPDEYQKMVKNFDVKANVNFDGHVEGFVAGDTLPVVDCNLTVSDGSFAYSALPAPLKNVVAALSAHLDLSKATSSSLVVKSLKASMKKSNLDVKGKVDDLMGNMKINADINGNVVMADVADFIPSSLNCTANGKAKIALHVAASLKQITSMDLANMKASGTIDLSSFDATYDSMHIATPNATVSLSLPSSQKRIKQRELAEIDISTPQMQFDMPAKKINVSLKDASIKAGVSNILDKKKPLETVVQLALERTEAKMDSIEVAVEGLKVDGTVNYDSTRGNILLQLDPRLNVAFSRTSLFMPSMPEAVRLASFQFIYKPGHCEIADADIHWGLSDYHLSGIVNDLEDWIDHKKSLNADFNFTSDYTDVDQLLALISGMGSNPDTIEAMRKEDGVDEEAKPFIVPLDMNVALHTHIKRCIAFENDLSDLAGNISIRDGKAILDQVGFVCKAARMQLTGIYKSPRPNHLYLGVDFHLLDIQIAELVDMIPYVDTLLPMITAFDGNADFHLALESYLDANYKPKTSTLLGSSAISGKDLVVLPGETFDMIAKYLMFNKKTVNKIDSLDVELTLFRNRIDVYPFLLSMDKYQVCVSGVHSLDNSCNYHLELLKSPLPMRLAVDVTGKLPKPKVALGTVKYNELFNPKKTDAIKTRTLEIKKMVREALEANVR